MRKSLTWDHGSEMAKHAALTLAITMPVYFAHPRSSWKRGTNENANALVRVHLPKSTLIPAPGPRPPGPPARRRRPEPQLRRTPSRFRLTSSALQGPWLIP